VSVRKQGGEDKGTVKLLTFAEEISQEVEEMMNPAVTSN